MKVARGDALTEHIHCSAAATPNRNLFAALDKTNQLRQARLCLLHIHGNAHVFGVAWSGPLDQTMVMRQSAVFLLVHDRLNAVVQVMKPYRSTSFAGYVQIVGLA